MQRGDNIAFSTKVENNNNNNALHITRRLDIDILLLEAANYPRLQSFFQLVRSSDEEPIVVQPPGSQNQATRGGF
jgi:hypothetical protein